MPNTGNFTSRQGVSTSFRLKDAFTFNGSTAAVTNTDSLLKHYGNLFITNMFTY
jgi:hypothetical protein